MTRDIKTQTPHNGRRLLVIKMNLVVTLNGRMKPCAVRVAEKRQQVSSWRKNLVYPIVMLLLLALTVSTCIWFVPL